MVLHFNIQMKKNSFNILKNHLDILNCNSSEILDNRKFKNSKYFFLQYSEK